MVESYVQPVSGHVYRQERRSGDRWVIKWRDEAGQTSAFTGRGAVARTRVS
jgi:hypothetical protein